MTPPTPAWHQRILRSELTPGLLLMATAALAIALANSPLAGTYFAALHVKLGPLSLHHWINDGLMALFFLVIGLEVKREFMVGQMSSWSARVLPGLAALGGMAVPALIYAATNLLMPGHLQGWAIPAATDVAFALAVLSFFSKCIPVALKVFLMAIAVIDDLGAVLMIALFYSSDILREVWQHPNGGTIRIDACAIDSGDGGHHDAVMGFCKPRFGRRVVPVKGVAGFSRQVFEKSQTRGNHLWLVGVDAAKSQIFTRLSRNQGIRFGKALTPSYFEQLASEKRVVRYVRGKPEARFERIKGKRAETLDATVYAMAVRGLLNQRLDLRAAELTSAAAPKKAQTVIRSSWLEK